MILKVLNDSMILCRYAPLTPAETLPNPSQLEKVPLETQACAGAWRGPTALLGSLTAHDPISPPEAISSHPSDAAAGPVSSSPQPSPARRPAWPTCRPTAWPGPGEVPDARPGLRLLLGLPHSRLGRWDGPRLPGPDLPSQRGAPTAPTQRSGPKQTDINKTS